MVAIELLWAQAITAAPHVALATEATAVSSGGAQRLTGMTAKGSCTLCRMLIHWLSVSSCRQAGRPRAGRRCWVRCSSHAQHAHACAVGT